jgi:hypothetical protein
VQSACVMLPRTGMDFVATMMHQGFSMHACMHMHVYACLHADTGCMGTPELQGHCQNLEVQGTECVWNAATDWHEFRCNHDASGVQHACMHACMYMHACICMHTCMQIQGAWVPLSCKGSVRTWRFKVQSACVMLPRTGMDFVATMMHQGIIMHACICMYMHACMQIQGAWVPLSCKGIV